MKARFISFLVCFLLAVGLLEGLMRVNGSFFHSLTDPLLLKAEILERSPKTNVLFIGTSRFVDGIDQKRFSEELTTLSGQSIQALNGAAVGSQGDRSAYFAEIAASNPGLTHVILEASPPALENGDLGFTIPGGKDKGAKKEIADPKTNSFPDRLEGDLQSWFGSRVALVQYRKSLRPRTLLKIPVLLCSGFVDPNIWNRGGLIRNLFSSGSDEVNESDLDLLSLNVVRPVAKPPAEISWRDAKEIAMLRRLTQLFEDSEVKVIWVTTPIFEENAGFSEAEEYQRMYQIVATESGVPFYDYSGRAVEPDYRRDSTHLNETGRLLFSTRLARDLAPLFKSKNTQD